MVVLIPTKEFVYADRLAGRDDLANADAIARLLGMEQLQRDTIREFLEERAVPVVDPLAAMRTAARTGPIYPSNEGGHPLSAGYRTIADAVVLALDQP
jgi:hypothetical protein